MNHKKVMKIEKKRESVTESGILENNELWKGRVKSKVMWRSEQ